MQNFKLIGHVYEWLLLIECGQEGQEREKLTQLNTGQCPGIPFTTTDHVKLYKSLKVG